MSEHMSETTLRTGDLVPDVTLPSHTGQNISLRDLKGRKVVLYFYPKDDTSGCTTEGLDFTRLYPEFRAADAEVLGISRDPLDSHCKFAEKYGFSFPLLSDTDEDAARKFDVLKEKNMYGKLVMGIERSTFVIDRDSRIVHIERKVKVEGHAERMLDIVRNIP